MLGHAVGDLAEVAADVSQGRAVPQQPGGQGVPGLVGDVVSAEVEAGDPGAEAGVEPGVGQGAAAVGVEDVGGEQGQVSALSSSGRAASVTFGEVGQGLLAAFFEPVKEVVGDADGRVQVADLGLVVPGQGQPCGCRLIIRPAQEACWYS
ncbi:hypothetical protein BIV23_35680 [Streptomyces monashensis]|uniref:Uncharacterized protein n=1 Tax=Streptomyces monashensis TaxID=1678012 RepID=A0A1S2PMJ5_9ACTN|nr:hypothetical protein BIV23_35680 [Streptomyces monashensis]